MCVCVCIRQPPSQQGNTSFPSSLYKTPNKPILKDNTFSPSIFLSHPDVGSNASSLSSSCAATQGHASFDLLTSPHSEAEGSTSGLGKSFVTSTPIRMEENKENVPHTSTSTSSRATAKRKLLDEPSDVSLSVFCRQPVCYVCVHVCACVVCVSMCVSAYACMCVHVWCV